MNKQLTTLEQIIAGWKIRYSATIYFNGSNHPDDWNDFWTGQVINVTQIGDEYGEEWIDCIQVRVDGTEVFSLDMKELKQENYEIQGFKYMGELGGNEEIPVGTKFRVKATGEVMEHLTDGETTVTLGRKDGISHGGRTEEVYAKSWIEPVFNQ